MLTATTGRGHVVKRPSKATIGTMLANLRRGNEHLVPARTATELCQTKTVSQEKVMHALLNWASDKPNWHDGFM
ncbi:hypothetical protein [Streptomyces sp. CAI-85]|uniref:hypothetical protein n=1 Tax=Streptomyces sp. CAI-85 TaxID=1472662 RepID=UPI0015872BE2|nr:hypothetical protein [Streptomyces sp. CAI-85]NUV59022.1 hypothetical protein [Streptomyces sp. CAI-85]